MTHPRELWAERAYTGTNSYVRVPYPNVFATFGQAVFRRAVLRTLRSRLSAPPALTVDLGCGVGDWALDYARFSRQVLAVDVNETFLAEGRLRALRAGVTNVDFVRTDVAALDLPRETALVGIGSVFQYMDEAEIGQVLARVAGAQAEGSVLYVRASISRGDPWSIPDATYRPAAFYDDCLARAGYVTRWFGTSAALVFQALHPGARRNAIRKESGRTAYANWILERRMSG